MLKYRIICVGKVKESFYRDQIQEYLDAIRKYHPIRIIEVDDEKTKEDLSEAERAKILDVEGDRILQVLAADHKDYIVPLCIDGKPYDTEKWSKRIRSLSETEEYEQITYIIGGSLGLSDKVIRRGNQSISYSRLTFPHQLIRVILLEQILLCDQAGQVGTDSYL